MREGPAAIGPAPVVGPGAGVGETTPFAGAGDFVALLKPRVMTLVVFTAFVGMVLAPGVPHPVIAFVALLCTAVGAGAAGALNMWYEADIDARMARTRGRPIPAGRMAPGEALGFGTTLALGAVMVMGLAVNLTAAALQEDPQLASLESYVDDSGEGRWTVQESIELAVPIPAITLSLQARFRSRQVQPFGGKLLAAMRNQFGGHAVRQAE